jgi:hypothetical protein
MHTSIRLGVAGLIIAALAVVGWASLGLQAQLALFQAQLALYSGNPPRPGAIQPSPFATIEDPPLEPLPTVHLVSRSTPASARTWQVLWKPLDMPFPNETALGDVLEYVRKATCDAEAFPDGLPIYVDPNGLIEMEKTTDSPIEAIDIRGIPLASSLDLLLKQLGLTFTVHDDGLVVISSETLLGGSVTDSNALMLDTLSKLNAEVSALRWEVAALRTGKGFVAPPRRTVFGGMSGGMVGMGGGMGGR